MEINFMYRTDINPLTKYGIIKINDIDIKYGYKNLIYPIIMNILHDYSRIKNIQKINKLYLAISSIITTPIIENNKNINFFIDLCGTTKYYIMESETYTIEN
jgi:hypothetical protein